MIKDLVIRNRSYRCFDQGVVIALETPNELVDLARRSGSAVSKQPPKYTLSADPRKNAPIFKQLIRALYPDERRSFYHTDADPRGGERNPSVRMDVSNPEFFVFYPIL